MFDKIWKNVLFIFFCGMMGGLVVLFGEKLLNGVKVDSGSLAEWFSGTLTAIGLIGTWIVSFLNSRVQLIIKARADDFYISSENEPIHINYFIDIYNNGKVPVEVRDVGLYVREINNKVVREKKFIPFYTDFKNRSTTIQPKEEFIARTNNMLLEDTFSDNAGITEDSGTVVLAPYVRDKSNKAYFGNEYLEIDMKELSKFGEITSDMISSGKIKYESIEPKSK